MATDAEAVQHNRRLGMGLFVVYLVLYGAFVTLVTVDYHKAGGTVFGGLNLAVVYGMVLIVSAFAIALLYMALAKSPTPSADPADGI